MSRGIHAHSTLYQVVLEHFETFHARAASLRDGEGLPRFVEQEFRHCRYALRPPIAEDRLRLDRDGHVWLTLRHRWAEGTTHLQFDPIELLE